MACGGLICRAFLRNFSQHDSTMSGAALAQYSGNLVFFRRFSGGGQQRSQMPRRYVYLENLLIWVLASGGRETSHYRSIKATKDARTCRKSGQTVRPRVADTH